MKSMRTILIVIVWFVVVVASLFWNTLVIEKTLDKIEIGQVQVFHILIFLFYSPISYFQKTLSS